MKTPDFSNFNNTFKGLRLSVVEIVALVSTIVFVGIVLSLYFNSIQPIKNKIAELETRKKQLTSQVITQGEQDKAATNQRVNAQKILDSLESFEARLRHRKQGIPDVINEVNQLGKAYKVRVGDVRFQTASADQLAAPTGANPTPTPAITRRDKLPNVYEGLGIDTTVEGDYHNLRRFISALERSRNFVIVNAISLQSIDEKNKLKASGIEGGEIIPGQPPMPKGVVGVPNNAAAPTSFPTTITVALKIEMETHFAREDGIDTSLAKPIPVVNK